MDNNNMIPAAPVAEKSGAKKSSGLMIATVLFGISTIALGTTLAIKMMNDESGNAGIENKTGNKCIVTQDDVENLDESEVSEIIASYDSEKEVRSLIDEMLEYANTKESLNIFSMAKTYDGGMPIELEEGGYTVVRKSFGILARAANYSVENLDDYSDTIVEFLASKGFEKNEKMSGDYGRFYDNGTLRCSVNYHTHPLGVNCSDTVWAEDEDIALANALFEASGNRGEDVVISADRSKIETSDDGNYEGIMGSIGNIHGAGGGYALYYHEIGSEEWTFVLSGNGIPSCGQFEGVPSGLFSDCGCSTENNEIKKVGDL